jgi:hypothetical protein
MINTRTSIFPECSLDIPTWSEARNAQKLPLVPPVKLFLRGCVSIWRNKHTVPPFCRLLAHLQLIIMMEALCDWTRSSTPGIRRLVLLTLVLGTQVCKLYSASTLVLFLSASCSWDGGSRASAQLSLNSPWMFPEYSLNIPWMFPEYSLTIYPWRYYYFNNNNNKRVRCVEMVVLCVLLVHSKRLFFLSFYFTSIALYYIKFTVCRCKFTVFTVNSLYQIHCIHCIKFTVFTVNSLY